MRNIVKLTLHCAFCLTLSFGMAGAMSAACDGEKKIPLKDLGILSVISKEKDLTVELNKLYRKMTGVDNVATFYLKPGEYTLEIEDGNGLKLTKEITIVNEMKKCIWVEVVEKTRPCPYDIVIRGREIEREGEPAEFFAFNVAKDAPTPENQLKYRWKVSPESVIYELGPLPNEIKVNTNGEGGTMLNIEVEVTDGKYDEICGQRIVRSTEIKGKKEP